VAYYEATFNIMRCSFQEIRTVSKKVSHVEMDKITISADVESYSHTFDKATGDRVIQ
jgi:hypothetical protein